MLVLLEALLYKFGFKKFSVEKLYANFLSGELSEDQLHLFLKIHQVKDFTALHERVKKNLEEGKHDPCLLTLFPTLLKDPRRMHVALCQVDCVIERDLEKGILRRKGKGNVVRRTD